MPDPEDLCPNFAVCTPDRFPKNHISEHNKELFLVKNIILDMGNVLLVYDPELYVANLCRPEAREIILKELFYGPDWPKQDLGLIGKPELFDLVSQRVPAEYHEDLKQVIFGWTDYMKPVKGAAAFLQKMKETGYHLFVLSNAGFDFHDYFPSFYDIRLFDGIVVSCDRHVIKPDPLIYRYLLETYHLNPSECLFIDDMERNVDGAKNCGIQGYLFTGDFTDLEEKLRT